MVEKDKLLRDKWAHLIGRFVMAFGDIENITYLSLVHIPRDRIFETASTLPFGKRVELIIDILQSNDEVNNEVKSSFQEKLSKSKELAQKRNLLVHNPVFMEIYQHDTNGELSFRDVIRSIKNENKILTLIELESLVAEIENLSSNLYEAYGAVVDDIPN